MLAKKLRMSQRELVRTISLNEIMDWMAFDLSCDPEFQKKINSIPVALPPEEEANAIRALLNGVCNIK
jgi:hypothetical protein